MTRIQRKTTGTRARRTGGSEKRLSTRQAVWGEWKAQIVRAEPLFRAGLRYARGPLRELCEKVLFHFCVDGRAWAPAFDPELEACAAAMVSATSLFIGQLVGVTEVWAPRGGVAGVVRAIAAADRLMIASCQPPSLWIETPEHVAKGRAVPRGATRTAVNTLPVWVELRPMLARATGADRLAARQEAEAIWQASWTSDPRLAGRIIERMHGHDVRVHIAFAFPDADIWVLQAARECLSEDCPTHPGAELLACVRDPAIARELHERCTSPGFLDAEVVLEMARRLGPHAVPLLERGLGELEDWWLVDGSGRRSSKRARDRAVAPFLRAHREALRVAKKAASGAPARGRRPRAKA